MEKRKVLEEVSKVLKEDEDLVGAFLARSIPPFWTNLISPLLSAFKTKTYYIAVTNKGIYIHMTNIFDKLVEYNFYNYDEILELQIKKGFLVKKMKFIFKNEEKINISAPAFGIEKLAKILPEVEDYLINKVNLK